MKFLNLGKFDNLIKLGINLELLHPKDRTVEENIFPAGQSPGENPSRLPASDPTRPCISSSLVGVVMRDKDL